MLNPLGWLPAIFNGQRQMHDDAFWVYFKSVNWLSEQFTEFKSQSVSLTLQNLEQCSRPSKIAFDLSQGNWTLSPHHRLHSFGSGSPQNFSHISPNATADLINFHPIKRRESELSPQPVFHAGRCIFLVSGPPVDRLLPSCHSSHLTPYYRVER